MRLKDGTAYIVQLPPYQGNLLKVCFFLHTGETKTVTHTLTDNSNTTYLLSNLATQEAYSNWHESFIPVVVSPRFVDDVTERLLLVYSDGTVKEVYSK